ncbi:MAG: hypothetical protein AAFP84_14580, partial [Actinomycetota bacterium]
DVTGLDKEFDYVVPDDLVDQVEVGSIVRVDLHGRRVGGWVTAILEATDVSDADLKPVAKVTGHGPAADVQELAWWAASRWVARRIRPFLVAAAPRRAVRSLPPRRQRSIAPQPSSPATTELLRSGGGVLRLAPRVDVLPAILSAVALGPTLVVVPLHADMNLIASRLRRTGATVAIVPDDWAAAAAGVDVVIGTRRAAWMPCEGLSAAVVLDEHDEALQDERTPTWHARDVIVERCRRAEVPFVLISPAPSLVAVEEYAGDHGVVHPPIERERRGWPTLEVVDRNGEEPWKRSLVTTPLIELLRSDQRVLCISNTTGRARVLACRSCMALTRCERCEAAVGLDDDGHLICRRCEEQRPPVCQRCGAGSFANLRPGVTRLREELEGAANRRVVAVTGADDDPPAASDVYVGTEAALHRVGAVDVVAFLEFDSEMLAPRFRASEQALALLVRASRLAPTVMVQTFEPNHEVIRAARTGDPGVVIDVERDRRRLLSLPPFGALAELSGTGLDDALDSLRSVVAADPDHAELVIGRIDERRALVRAPDWPSLNGALDRMERPAGGRLRVAIDPPRV